MNLHYSHADQLGNNFQADTFYNHYNHIQYIAVSCWHTDNFPKQKNNKKQKHKKIKQITTMHTFPEMNSEPYQTSKRKLYTKIVNGVRTWTVFAASSILDVCQCYEQATTFLQQILTKFEKLVCHEFFWKWNIFEFVINCPYISESISFSVKSQWSHLPESLFFLLCEPLMDRCSSKSYLKQRNCHKKRISRNTRKELRDFY